MKRRLIYPIIIITAFLFIHFIIQPYLFEFVRNNEITLEEYYLYYFIINLSVILTTTLFIYFEGKYISGIQAVGGILIVTALMDLNCIYSFPKVALVSNVISMFAGILMFGFGLVSIKKSIFKRGAGIFFMLLGAIYIFRFPFFMDFWFFYVKKYLLDVAPAEGYFLGTLYVNYLIVGLQLIALDIIINENHNMSRYTKARERFEY